MLLIRCAGAVVLLRVLLGVEVLLFAVVFELVVLLFVVFCADALALQWTASTAVRMNIVIRAIGPPPAFGFPDDLNL